MHKQQDKKFFKTKKIEKLPKKLAIEYGSTNPPSFGLGVAVIENSGEVKKEKC